MTRAWRAPEEISYERGGGVAMPARAMVSLVGAVVLRVELAVVGRPIHGGMGEALAVLVPAGLLHTSGEARALRAVVRSGALEVAMGAGWSPPSGEKATPPPPKPEVSRGQLRERCAALIASGATRQAIAVELGLSMSSTKHLIEEMSPLSDRDLSDPRRVEAIRLRSEGRSITELRQLLGVSSSRLSRWFGSAGETKREIRADRVARAVALHESGMSVRAIAEELGMSESAVSQWLLEERRRSATAG